MSACLDGKGFMTSVGAGLIGFHCSQVRGASRINNLRAVFAALLQPPRA